MIRLPMLKDELAFLEKLLPDLETRPHLGHLAIEIKKRIDKIRQEIRALQEKVCDQNSKYSDYDEKGECAETIGANEVAQPWNEPSKDGED